MADTQKLSKKIGRPTKLTAETIKSLEDSFSRGHSEEEACILAGIGLRTLYDYCDKNEAFRTKKELLKATPTIKARKNVIDALENKDINTSKWYLERKTKEFVDKKDVTSDGEKVDNITVTIIEDKREVSND